ncbi:MAG: exosortase H-associated membrane protein [Xanthomonadaceae bacterium]|nr:exosortase H-associated membrane protein [Xanthomonadaceae bacterium]
MFGPLKTLLFLAVLWLPLSFFVWFYFAQLWVTPIASMASTVLQAWLPQVFTGVEQTQHILSFITTLPVDPAQLAGMDLSQGRPAVVVDANPMIYGYSIPVLVGLVMATPLSNRRRALQVGIGLVVLLGVQTFGTVFDVLKSIGLQAGQEGARVIAEAGLSPNMIAFCYQFGYLVLPAITPVILWVMFNQPFIQSLVTAEGSDIPTPGTDQR